MTDNWFELHKRLPAWPSSIVGDQPCRAADPAVRDVPPVPGPEPPDPSVAIAARSGTSKTLWPSDPHHADDEDETVVGWDICSSRTAT
jgi:hypothetical protein